VITGKVYKYIRPGIVLKPWGLRELTVIDPSFNRLMFYSPKKRD
jgi:hypothetical protein